MKALVYQNPWELRVGKIDEPTLSGSYDVKIEVSTTGICGTDIGIAGGLYAATKGIILGHEATGVIVEKGCLVESVQVGDRVAIDPTYYCMQCKKCRAGVPNHCVQKSLTETGVSAHGTFTQYYITQERFVYPLQNETKDEEAIFTEPLSCVLTGVRKLKLRQDESVLIFGAGPIGLLYCKSLALHGMRGIVIEPSTSRLERAEGVLPQGWRVFPSLSAAKIGERSQSIVVDTSSVMLEAGVSLLQDHGQLLMVGLRNAVATINPSEIADRSLTILGSIDSQNTFEMALGLIESKAIVVADIYDGAFFLDEFNCAFEQLGCHLKQKKMVPSGSVLKLALKSG